MTTYENDNASTCTNCAEWTARNRTALIFGAGVLAAAATIASYLAWCPESPRFDRKYLRRQWWQRHGF